MIQGVDKVTGLKLLAGATPEEWVCPTDPVINLAPGFPVLWGATWGCIPIPWRVPAQGRVWD